MSLSIERQREIALHVLVNRVTNPGSLARQFGCSAVAIMSACRAFGWPNFTRMERILRPSVDVLLARAARIDDPDIRDAAERVQERAVQLRELIRFYDDTEVTRRDRQLEIDRKRVLVEQMRTRMEREERELADLVEAEP